jgi:hypothetical protein
MAAIQSRANRAPGYHRLIFLAVCTALWVGAAVYGFSKMELASVSQPVGDMTTAPIAGNGTAGQTFVVPCRGLYRVDVYFAAYDRADAPQVVFHLRDSPTSDRDLARIVRAPAPIAKAGYQTFEFAPIADSAERLYYFYFRSKNADVTSAFSIWANGDDVYPGGERFTGHQSGNGDLVFRAYCRLDGVSKADLLLGRLAAGKPLILGEKKSYIVLFGVYAVVLTLFLDQLGQHALSGEEERSQ